MKIAGMQKLSLVDYPEKICCTVFSAGCNFCCPFCHNAALVTRIDGSDMPLDEVTAFLHKRKGLLQAVCVSGGEPLLQDGVQDFIKQIKDMGYLVKLDTNGSMPDKLQMLCQNKLVDFVAMDIKNSKAKYADKCTVFSAAVAKDYALCVGLCNYVFNPLYALLRFFFKVSHGVILTL